MDIFETTKGSILGIIRGLAERAKDLVRKEVQLAKTEFSEKISEMFRDATQLAVGGLVAYTGLLVFLMGLGWLVAWALAIAGLQPMFAAFVGLSSVGLLVILIGAGLLLKAKADLAKRNLEPVRTAATLQEMQGEHSEAAHQSAAERAVTQSGSAKIQAEVEATEAQMGEALHELGRRLSPHQLKERLKYRIESEPYSAGVFAMVAGLVSGLLVRRKFRRA